MKKLLAFTMIMGVSFAVFAQKADSTKTTRIKLRGTPVAGTDPLVVIDGNKQYIRGTSSLHEINQDNIESITVLKDSLATAKYGAEGFAGVIEVRTKNNPLAKHSLTITPNQIDRLPLKGKVAGFSVRPQTSSTKNGNYDFSLNKSGVKIKNGKDAPLYIIDGKEAAGIEYIDNDSIEHVTILKDASSTAEYGDKAKNGVIIITTKKAKTTPKKN